MIITYETNENGDSVKVTTLPSGATIRELDRPMPPLVAPWTKKEFLLKFTPAEYASIKAATQVNAEIDYYWQLFTVAEFVDKADPTTQAGIQGLEAAGLLAPGRAVEILA